MTRRAVAEAEISHERWLVSYADLLTLLMAFFVVMYSIARLPESDFQALSAQLSTSFARGEVDKQPESDTIIDLGGAAGETGMTEQVDIKEKEHAHEKLGDKIQKRLEGDNSVRVSGNEEWLEIRLDSNLLFRSGQAKLREEAKRPLDNVASELGKSAFPLRIEGFTDDVPISSRLFASNWELSFARATAVLRYLGSRGVEPQRMSAIGYGEFYPLADNGTAEGRAQNRRVTIKLAKHADPLAPISTEIVADSPAQPAQTTEQGKAATKPQAEELPFQTIKLKGGGLLFTNDKPAVPAASE